MISCFRRSKVSFTPSFKSLPKLVTLTPPRARTNISYMCPPGKETVEIANANYEKAKLTPPPPPSPPPRPPHKTKWLWKSHQAHPFTNRTYHAQAMKWKDCTLLK